ncbi:Beige/BEACH domain containing protein [Anopheles sinensis]|uniref:Beige/BEACH domain containing protein n=1 Tax=Anopheles sinensis TaxID=74873 RepID=A0A084WPL0_ANOSI|nr:Beige/BEACH domain containing protein [Anopheles sinensis]
MPNNNHQNVEQFSESGEKENTESDYDSALDETVNVPETAEENESQVCSDEKVLESSPAGSQHTRSAAAVDVRVCVGSSQFVGR